MIKKIKPYKTIERTLTVGRKAARQIAYCFGTLLLLFSHSEGYAQKEMNNWLWGLCGNGISFNTDPPSSISIPGRKELLSGNVSVSDSNGAFLFASNGLAYFNKYGARVSDLGPSAPRGILFMPVIGNASQFYVFRPGDPVFELKNKNLDYCIYDASLNNGVGGLIVKENILASYVYNGLAATPHANGKDYWLTARQFTPNQILSFLISEKGVSKKAVISYPSPKQDASMFFLRNNIRFNHKGDQLYLPRPSCIELYNFDNATAQLSNPIVIKLEFCLAAEFSPDDSKLYVSVEQKGIFQIDLSSKDSIQINASIKNIYNKDIIAPDLQMGPDKKIYFIRVAYKPQLGNPKGTYYPLYSINSPNSLGKYCRPDSVKFFYNDSTPHHSLPYYVTPFLYEPYRLDFPDEVCPNEAIFFRLKGEQNIRSQSWSFGDGESNTSETPRHTYLKDGIYEVVATITDHSNKTYRCRKEITVKTKIKNIGRIQHD